MIGSPASRNILAVPPLPRSVKPKFFRFFPRSTSPILFDTDNSAEEKDYLLKNYVLFRTSYLFDHLLPLYKNVPSDEADELDGNFQYYGLTRTTS